VKLRCISRYYSGSRGLVYEAGKEYEIEASLASFLLADAPGCFRVASETKAVKRPPRNKAVQESEDKAA